MFARRVMPNRARDERRRASVSSAAPSHSGGTHAMCVITDVRSFGCALSAALLIQFAVSCVGEVGPGQEEAPGFDAGRFDCVVSTWTLCTIPAVSEALAEIRRVLKPSGEYLFLEHGRSNNPGVVRWQDRLDRVHGLFTGGCHVNRPIDQLLTDAYDAE